MPSDAVQSWICSGRLFRILIFLGGGKRHIGSEPTDQCPIQLRVLLMHCGHILCWGFEPEWERCCSFAPHNADTLLQIPPTPRLQWKMAMDWCLFCSRNTLGFMQTHWQALGVMKASCSPLTAVV